MHMCYDKPGSQLLDGALPTALLIAYPLIYALVLMYADKALHTWGWRLPFLLSILGAAVGAYIRSHLKVWVQRAAVCVGHAQAWGLLCCTAHAHAVPSGMQAAPCACATGPCV